MKKYVIGAIAIPFLVAMCIPGFENFRFRIPAYQELVKSEGVAFFDRSKEFKYGLPLGIKDGTETTFVTCRRSDAFDKDCVARKDREVLEGQQVSVLWSEQPIFIWKREKRAFQIIVNGKVLRSYDEMVRHYEKGFSYWLDMGISLLSFFILIFMIAYLLVNCLQKRKQ